MKYYSTIDKIDKFHSRTAPAAPVQVWPDGYGHIRYTVKTAMPGKKFLSPGTGRFIPLRNVVAPGPHSPVSTTSNSMMESLFSAMISQDTL